MTVPAGFGLQPTNAHRASTSQLPSHELMNEALARITHDHRGNWEAKLHSALRQKGNVRRRL